MQPATGGIQRLLVVVCVSFVLLLGGAAVAADGVSDVDEREEFVILLDGVDLDATDGDPVTTLKAHAAESQAPVIAQLEDEPGVRVENSFWITNGILVSVKDDAVEPATFEAMPGVANVSEHGTVAASAVSESPGHVGTRTASHTDGLEMIGAPAVWSAFGTQGEGITVAILDTGVDADHPDITVDGWRDFTEDDPSSTPVDYGDHGTHVSGTLIGGDASGTHIGVAPGASHIHGAVLTDCDSLRCFGTLEQLIEGMQWAVEEEADVVSMSLGTENYEAGLIEAVRNTQASGTVVVGAIGNDGPGTSGSPGNVYETVSVGAVDGSGSVAGFSGGEEVTTIQTWGTDAPENWPDSYVVPDVTAPGVGVLSAEPGGGYQTKQGTSMATPHVAGTIALAQAATERDVPIDELVSALEETAWKPPGEPGEQDNRYGHGIIDAHAYVSELMGQATVEGTVRDMVTDEPVAGATVTIDGQSATTEANGTYEIRGITGDTDHEVGVTADGYEETTEVASIPVDVVTTLDVDIAGDGEVAVALTDELFGNGVPDANVSAGAYPAVESGDGEYVVPNVPSGKLYALTASVAGYMESEDEVWVEPGIVVERTIELTGDATLKLTVRDGTTEAALPGASLVIERHGGSTGGVETDDAGGIVLAVPGTGDPLVVTVDTDGYLVGTDELTPTSGAIVERTIGLEGDATLTVSVTEATFSDPAPDALLELSGDRGTYPVTESDGGSYVIEYVPSEARYDLAVDGPGYEPVEEPITVEGPGEMERAIELTGDATLAVEIVDAVTEAPIEAAMVSLERETGSTIQVDLADGAGEATVPGTGESYEVHATATGYEAGEASAAVGEGEAVALAVGLTGDVDVVVEAIDSHFGSEVADTSVELVGEQGTYTGVDGVEGVPSLGEYELTVTAAGYEPVTRIVRFDGAGTIMESVALDGDATLSVTVTDGEMGLSDATIRVERADGADFAVESGADGEVVIGVPGTGDSYELTADVAGYEVNSTTTGAVESGSTEVVTIRVTAESAGLPGFGAVAAIAALLVGGGWYRRRCGNL